MAKRYGKWVSLPIAHSHCDGICVIATAQSGMAVVSCRPLGGGEVAGDDLFAYGRRRKHSPRTGDHYFRALENACSNEVRTIMHYPMHMGLQDIENDTAENISTAFDDLV